MKAAVWYEFGGKAKIEDVSIDPTGPGKVKVQIKAVAICGSDVHSVLGEHGKPELPIVAGHEVSGIVTEVGDGVTYVKPGDHVVLSLVKSGCGQCYNCMDGHPELCLNRTFEFRCPSCYTLKDGRRPTSCAGSFAGFAEYTIAPEECIVKIPEDIAFDSACLLGCGVISGFYGVINAAQVKPLKSVLVVGCGGVGLSAIQGARFVGAHPIIAQDTIDSKLAAAKRFGATHTINVKTEDALAKANEITNGRGVDYVFMTVAAGVKAVRAAWKTLAHTGMQIIIGHTAEEWMSEWDLVEFVGGKYMTGSAMGRTRIRVDIPKLIDLYRAGRLELDGMISRRWSLEEVSEAITDTHKGGALRNVIIL